ncbi:MAG: hypothetical protein R3362_04955, partial [Rhodothermales bacterium]|nr:hypothetical protein [Rhodothermales bacterium]
MTLPLLLLSVWGALLPDSTAAPAADPPDAHRQVITRAEIEAAGLYRLPDLYRLLRGVRTTTVEGFTWRAHLGGGGPFAEEAWTLLVDGERVDLGLFGRQNLSALPVGITQVDSVEVWSAPQVVAGAPAWGGVIHVHTRRPGRGPTLRVGTSVGNEVGDPGPYRFVPERRTPNVDKFGSDYEGAAGWGGRRWRVQGGFKWLRFYDTDPAVSPRASEAVGLPNLRLFGAHVRAEAEALGGRHALLLLGSGVNDLWFFDPLGREVPTRQLFGQAGLTGAVPLRERAGLTYRLGLVQHRLDERDRSRLGLDPAWERSTVRANVEAHVNGERAALRGGVTAERTGAERADGFTLGTAYGSVTFGLHPNHQHRFDGALSTAGGAVAVAMAYRADVALGPSALSGTVAVAERLPEQLPTYGYWRARGYGTLEPELDYDAPEPPGTATRATLRADLDLRLAAGLRAEFGAGFDGYRGLYVEVQPQAPNPDALRPARPVLAVPDGEGGVVSAGVAVEAERGPWTVRASWDGREAVRGDDAFERAWAAVPDHRLGTAVTVRPDGSFSAWGGLAWHSAARWPA